MLDLVELTGFEKHYPWQLSGGMQQRVSIARALSLSPGAAAHGRAVRRARRDDARASEPGAACSIWAETGSTVVFVTHSISEAVFLSTRVVVMSPRPGRVTASCLSTFPSRVRPRRGRSRGSSSSSREVRELLHARGPTRSRRRSPRARSRGAVRHPCPPRRVASGAGPRVGAGHCGLRSRPRGLAVDSPRRTAGWRISCCRGSPT